MSEHCGEKIDIIEWSADSKKFIEEALSPAKVINVEIVSEEDKRARVDVLPDQQSLAIGKGGQNVRLAVKLTGWKIDIQAVGGSLQEAEETETKELESDIDYGTEIYEETPKAEADTTEEKQVKDEEKSESEPKTVGETEKSE
jgi:N utilization substance protein A